MCGAYCPELHFCITPYALYRENNNGLAVMILREDFRFMEEKVENTNQLIGCCGLGCEICDARIATLRKEIEK